MSSDYYTRNLDQLQPNTIYSTPRNCVLETNFSDAQSVNNEPAGILTLVYTGTGGETSLQDDDLIGATIITLSRDGLNYTPVTDFSIATKKEYKFYPQDGDEVAGTIVFHDGLPPLESGEDVVISYVAEGSSAVSVTEPVTVAEGKAWIKVEVQDDDGLIEALITAARHVCEGYAGLSFVERTITAILRNDLGNIRLPYGPTGTVTAMYDVDGTEIVSTGYIITGITSKRVMTPKSCYLKVVYTAGYTVLPKIFKTAILMQLAWMYSNRGDAQLASALASEAEMLLKPYRSIV